MLDIILPGDNVMADTGFDIADVLNARRATLTVPECIKRKKLSSRDEVITTRNIAKVRIFMLRES